MSEARFIVADVFEAMASIPDGSVDLIVTSPPFLALRSYLPADHPDKVKEIGSEATPAAFLSTLLRLTEEWRRVLAPHGSLCVELGDTYSGSSNDGGPQGDGISGNGGPRWRDRLAGDINEQPRRGPGWPLAKSLCGIPDAYALSLEYGWNMLNPTEQCERWRVRNKIVWHRPNPPVGALGDKVRPSTSYVTIACVSDRRWFDLDAERSARPDLVVTNGGNMDPRNERDDDWRRGHKPESGGVVNPAGAPPLDCWFDTTTPDVWTIATHAYAGAHYATFPPALPRRLINLMCPRQVCTTCGEPRRRVTDQITLDSYRRSERPQTRRAVQMAQMHGLTDEHIAAIRAFGIRDAGWSDCGHDTWRRGLVLDPFAGSGTTLQAASELGRDSIGIDLDSRNLDLARARCGMFLVEESVA